MPHADVVTFTTHKVLRGPRSGALVCKAEHAAEHGQGDLPDDAGRPQMHTIAAKAVNFKECATRSTRSTPRTSSPTASSSLRACSSRHPPDDRRHRHPPRPARPAGCGVTGKEAEERADAAGIVLNKNAIPFDPQKPNIASGIRVGTPSVTIQGMGLEEMKQIAALIHKAVTEGDADPDHAVSKDVRARSRTS